MKRQVAILPRFGKDDPGGVAAHVRALHRHLPRYGWEVLEQPAGNALVHLHAFERYPEVDVTTNHGIYPIKDGMPEWQQDLNVKIFENLRLATRVVAVSRWTAAQWGRLVGRGAGEQGSKGAGEPVGDVTIIPNGVDLDDWKDVPRGVWRARLRIGNKPLVLWGKSGLSEVLDPTPAFELALRRPDVTVVAPLDRRLLVHVPKNFVCVGLQPFPAMQALIADADMVLGTVCENHALQIVEALACGTPVLGYDWGGTGETLRHRHELHELGELDKKDEKGERQYSGGVLVAPGDLDALVAGLDAVLERRAELAEEGQALAAERYQWSFLVGRLAQVYEAALEERSSMGQPGRVKVSIIIPVYNKGPWIAETLESAMSQRGAPPYEIIVVDDGSKDNSLQEVGNVARANIPAKASGSGKLYEGKRTGMASRVRVYANPNRRVAGARNFGIEQAEGEYICCLDADDLIAPQFLGRLCAALDADPGLGIAYSDMMPFGVNADGMPFETLIKCSEYDFAKLRKGNFIPCCNVFRKAAWRRAGGYKDINPSWEDYELWLNMGKLGWPGRRVPGGYFYYRKVQASGRDHESHGQEWRLRAIVNSYHRDLYPPMTSVVIPCYNQSGYLPDAINSALAQTFVDLEVVVVDDGNAAEEAERIAAVVAGYDLSPDPSPAMGGETSTVRLVRLEENRGLAGARNAGIEAARGQWIVPLDADDVIAPNFVEEMLKATGLDPRVFAYGDSVLWWSADNRGATAAEGERAIALDDIEARKKGAWVAGLPGKLKLLPSHDYDFNALLARVTWPCTTLYAKEAWKLAGGYKPAMSAAGGWEDWEFAITLGEIGVCGQRVAQPVFAYRQHSLEQMRYKAEQVKPQLQETMRRLHAAVYRGERPMACCGRGRRADPTPETVARAAAEVAAAPGGDQVVVRYVGNSMGTMNWTTPSGRVYKFGIAESVQNVRREDAAWFAQHPHFRVVTA